MKGLKAAARETLWENNLLGLRIPLYYNIMKDTVATEEKSGFHFVTFLIGENTEKDIEKAVNRWLNM